MWYYRTVFPKSATLIVVIHVESLVQASRNAAVAREAGADGVFLINHVLPYPKLVEIYTAVRSENSDWWIGLNLLDLSARNAIDVVPADASGLWTDNAGIDETDPDPFAEATLNWKARLARAAEWRGLYFGGVAFKYQPRVVDAAAIARGAKNCMDVITTSGEATGSPPNVRKIRAMKAAIGDFPLAVASGITPENVSQYLGLADCFLVATGVSRSFTEFDPERVRALADKIHAQ